jgi:beta-lactam-binding protein with PASTA domain
VVASVALVVAVAALVVALTRSPGAAKAATSTPSTLSTRVQIPDVLGMRLGKARQLLTGLGLVVTVTRVPSPTVAKADVVSETPSAGTPVSRGASADLVVSTGP